MVKILHTVGTEIFHRHSSRCEGATSEHWNRVHCEDEEFSSKVF